MSFRIASLRGPIPMSNTPSLLEMLRKRVSELEMRDPPSSRLPPEVRPLEVRASEARPPHTHPASASRGDYQFDETLPFREAKERAVTHWERWYISELVARNGGNLSKAARSARMDRKYLRSLVLRYAAK